MADFMDLLFLTGAPPVLPEEPLPEEEPVPVEPAVPEEESVPRNIQPKAEDGTESGEPAESGESEETVVLSETTAQPEPAPMELPAWSWTGIGFAAGLLLAFLTAAIAGLVRRQKRRKKAPAPLCGSVSVEKLHEQGARKSQQDCFSVSPETMLPTQGLLAVVADGMGGLSDGDKVSQAAVTAIMNGFYTAQGTPQQVLLTLLGRANQAVNRLLGPDGLRSGGSTLIVGLIRDGAFHYLSVGDSRICLFRDGALFQLNREHVFRQELCLRAVNGESTLQEALEHPKGGGLTSFLGMGQLKYVDLPAQPVKIRPGDKFILMSDGVYNALSEQELTEALRQDSGAAQAMGAAIAAMAYTNQDNYTAVVLTCNP